MPKVRSSKFLRASVETGEATASAPLGPLLGQLQIPLLEFCNAFNDYSMANYNELFDLTVRLRKRDSKYTYVVECPFVSFFIHQFYLEYGLDLEEQIYSHYIVGILDIWYVLQLQCSVRNLPVSWAVQMLFGYFHTSIVKQVCLS
jgi:ribosomal protein L11